MCHDGNEGEWVLQVPYFPPYQTVEEDFNAAQVREMIWSSLLGNYDGVAPRHWHWGWGDCRDDDNNDDESDDGGSNFDFKVLSVRPWRMSC